MKKILLIPTAFCLLSGCGTVVKLVDPSKPYESYAGTKYDWQMAQKWGLPILDLPLSFLLDTALLPYAWAEEAK
ncbi:YceK/YidQ family lipoprotein [Avibacterium sp. 20-126]|uniref:YceK/YidQ family lipoprotein n=1 Tax=Avibacterium sp. 20-126 TaxID=2911524 RepID=UPI00218A2F7D|nr:YceK/YidQ family lipoprotein [Avibacterium sp. 20-126]